MRGDCLRRCSGELRNQHQRSARASAPEERGCWRRWICLARSRSLWRMISTSGRKASMASYERARTSNFMGGVACGGSPPLGRRFVRACRSQRRPVPGGAEIRVGVRIVLAIAIPIAHPSSRSRSRSAIRHRLRDRTRPRKRPQEDARQPTTHDPATRTPSTCRQPAPIEPKSFFLIEFRQCPVLLSPRSEAAQGVDPELGPPGCPRWFGMPLANHQLRCCRRKQGAGAEGSAAKRCCVAGVQFRSGTGEGRLEVLESLR